MSNLHSWSVLDMQYVEQKHLPYAPKKVDSSRGFQLPTAKHITLSEFSPASQGAITAHRIRDYRRRSYSLILLPNISVAIDKFLSPVEVSSSAVLQT